MAVRLFFAGIIVLLVFIGCGGGGGGGGSGSALVPGGSSVVVSGTISGTIAVDQAVSALRPDISSFSPSLRFLDSFVMIEELPNVSTRADQDGKFVFENVPFGTYRIIARITSLSGRMYKLRSTAQSLTQSDPQKAVALNVTQPDLAEHQIRMMIKDLNGNPIGKCKVWFWGEQFTLDASGYYVSPYMPAGASGLIKVEPPADKELSGLEFNIPATTFNPDNVEIVGVTLPTAGITNKAPIVSITTDKYPESGSAFLRLFGNYSDPEGEPMTTSWLTNVSTFTYVAKDYADWAVPSISASVTVYFSASEDGRYYPRLTSLANLNINVASSGEVSFPGEILLRPVTRSVDIVGSSTSQVAGNTTASYEAKTNFPPGLQLYFNWTVDRGTLLSSATASIISWRSPTLSPGVTQIASIAVAVTDGIGTATKEIQVRITSVPTVTISQPTATAFEPGLIVFTGSARDYLNTAISPDSMSWYVATDTQPFVLGQTGGATFTWQFVSQGSYTVALEAFDANGVTGTGTKKITIINARPVCAITQPLNDASFRPNTSVTFVGAANDQEDGAITASAALVWTSDIDGVIGSGTTFTLATMTSSRHLIRFSATDSGGAVGSTSIVIWYDVPARISFTPADRSVFFAGYNIPFSAVGTDTDNTPLDSSKFNWYLNDLPDIWRDGASFSITAGAYVPGANRVRVEGPAQFETAVSPTHVIQMGWPVASITSPASGTRFEPLDVVSFAAVPNSTGTLSLQWYLNDETLSFGSGSTANYAPPNGAHRVTYIGSDSQGIVSSSTINIVVERIPIVSFFPLNGYYLFTGKPVDFAATCLDSDDNDIADDRVSWLFNGIPWTTVSGKTFSRTQPGQLASGTHAITLIASGPYGTVGSITNTITVGISAAAIVNPASNATFLPGTLITFEGTPGSTGPIDMEWWATYGTSAPIKIGDGATVATNTLPDGYPIITYMGTDSSGFVSSASRKIGIGQFPEMDFTPADGTVFFGSQDVVFTGVGTDSIDGTIPASNMAWYVEGDLHTDGYSVMTITLAEMTTLGPGTKTIELRGTNTIGAVGVKTKTIYLGVPDPMITWPAQDTVIPLATPFTFTALPDSITGPDISEPLTMRWLLNGAPQLTTGATLTITLPGGIHNLTYIGTDSGNLGKFDKVRVIVSNSPTITFSPTNDSQIFVGRPFTLEAGGAGIATETVKWSLDGGATVWKTGSPKVIAAGELAVGSYDISAEGTNAVGVVATMTNENIFYGHPLLAIASPTSGIRVARSTASLVFEGSPANASSGITLTWQRSDGVATAAVAGTAINNTVVLLDGWNMVTITGTDIAGNQSSSTVSVLKNDPPALTIWPADTASNSFFFAGRPVQFNGAGTSSLSLAPVAGSTMKWHLSGTTDKTGSSTVTYITAEQAPLNTWRALTLEGTDDIGTSNVSDQVNVWFGCSLAAISQPASGSVFVPGQTVNLVGGDSLPVEMAWYVDGTHVASGSSFSAVASSTVLPVGRRTIRYQGIDSSGFTSSATIQILINASASMVMNPGEDSEFFKNRNVVLSGYGTSLAGQAIATSTFKWLVNGTQRETATNPVSLAYGFFSNGENLVRLEGADEFGAVSSITRRLYYGYSLASITSPASDTRFDEGENVTFNAINDTFFDLHPEWLIDGVSHLTDVTSFSKSDLAQGIRTITYRIADSSGFVSSATIQVLINNRPDLEIKPVDGGFFFAGHPVTIYGYGTSTTNLTLAPASLTWYIDGILKPVGATLAIADGALTGEHEIKLIGRDFYGTTNTAVASFTFGYTAASITYPASGASFDPLNPDAVTFTAVPNTALTPITMGWFLDSDTATKSTSVSYALTPSSLSRGWHTITYKGTDASDYISSSSIQVLVNRPPVMTFTPVGGSVFFEGSTVTFSGSGTSYLSGSEDIATFVWYVDGTQRATGKNVNLSVWMATAKYYDIKLEGIDEFGTVGSLTQTIYYKYPAMSITSPAAGWVRSPGTNLNLLGTPELDPVIKPAWYIQGVTFKTVQELIPAGAYNPYVLPADADLYTLTLIATDSNGFETFDTVQITVNDTINAAIIPGNDPSHYFAGYPVTFIGSGTDANGTDLLSTNMKWLLNDTLPEINCAIGTYAVTFNPGVGHGLLKTGVNKLQLMAADTLGATNSAILYQINYGHPPLDILSPASGTVTLTTPVTFTGVNASSTIRPSLKWYGYHHATNATSSFATANNISSIDLPVLGTYTVSFAGTDTAGVWSTGTSMIFKNALPTVNFNSPASNSVFFAGRDFTLSAGGTEAISGGALGPASFTWYRDAVSSSFKSGPTPTVTAVDLSVGTHTLYVSGTDQYGTVGTSTVKAIYYGHSLPAISSPTANIHVGYPGAGDFIVFKGSPASTAVDLKWYLGNGGPLVELPEIIDTMDLEGVDLVDGWNTIYYEGTDDAGNVSTASVMVLKSLQPSITFTPASNSVYFVGRDFKLEATATEALPPGNFITGTDLKWYRGAVQIANDSSVTIAAGSWTVGTHTIYVTAKDSNGVVATAAAQAFYYGHTLPTIASPSSNIRVDAPAPATMNFVGSLASSTIDLQWYLNNVLITGATANTLTITTPSAFPLVDDQNNKIEYTARDDAGNPSTATVMVLVRSEPAMNILPASGSQFFAVAGNQVTFTGSGVDNASMTWQRDALAPQTGINPITFSSLTTGWHTVKLTGTDEFGVSSYTTSMFYYGHTVNSITSPTAGQKFETAPLPVTVNFTGTPDLSGKIAMQWRWLEDASVFGAGPTATISTFTRGLQTIAYTGTDDGSVVSSKTVQILVNSPPLFSIASPTTAGKFFGGQSLYFSGAGSDTETIPGPGSISAASLTWYLGASTLRTATASFFAGASELGTGSKVVRLQGTDEYATVGSLSISITTGLAIPTISSPTSGIRLSQTAAGVVFAGSANDTGNMEWFSNKDGSLGAGNTITFNTAVEMPTRDWHSVTYIGTDTAGTARAASVNVLIDDPPAMVIASPTAGGKYFGGQSLYFEGSGTDSSPAALAVPASVSWYIDGVFRSTGFTYTAPVAQLPTGTRIIRFEGKDEFGIIGSTAVSIEVGLANPTIASPAASIRLGESVDTTFSGSANLTGNMTWYSDIDGELGTGVSLTFNTSILTRGWHNITYLGSDTAGTQRSASVAVLIDDLPTFTTSPFISFPAKFADGPEYGGAGNYIPIHLITPGAISVSFGAVATNGDGSNIPLTPGTSMNWYLNGVYEGTGDTKTLNFENPGSFTFRVAATDEYNVTATATFVFWLWETETYTPTGMSEPASIIRINDTNLAVADSINRVVYKLPRDTDTAIAARGDLSAPSTATVDIGFGNTLVDISMNTTDLFVLASNGIVQHYIKRYNLTSFAFDSEVTEPNGLGVDDALDDPRGIAIDGNTAVYVSDFGNGVIKKFDLTGTFVSKSLAVAGPYGIKYLGTDQIYVAANGSDQLFRYKNVLNVVADWNSAAVTTDATHFIKGATNNYFYVTDPSGSKVNVIDSNGAYVYSFGSAATFAAPFGVTIAATAGYSDMYITDRTGNKIVRFRAKDW